MTQFRYEIADFYTTSIEVQPVLANFLLVAVFLQLADSLDAPLQGALRGYKDVHATFVLAVISYWVIGLPAGWSLAHFTDLGPAGYWLGLITGVGIGAILLMLRLRRVQRRYRLEMQ